MRVLIVDDERLALGRLASMLGQIGDLEIIAALESGIEAVAAIGRLHPDLVLLDIEMPQMDGFDVVEAVARQAAEQAGGPPLIAFVTAYPHFALEAFDTGAIDFICKPIRLPRLEKLLARARRALAARDATERLDDLRSNLQQLREATAHVEEQHFWVRNRGELLRISTNSVQWIEAQASYVHLHLDDCSYLVRNSIGALADQLASQGYVRVHKSALVNRAKVVRVTHGVGNGSVVLEGGAEIRIGRKYRGAVQQITRAAANADPMATLAQSGQTG